MLIDEAEITVLGGNGGSGKASFFPGLKSGPDGGNGGKGGDVYAALSTDITALNRYASQKKYKAKHGYPGGGFLRDGKDGEDLYIPVPPSTTIIDLDTQKEFEITVDNPQVLLCRGGKGGKGNNALKSSTRVAPRVAQAGEVGEQKRFKLILKLIADFGLIGLPNAGKSSLLNELTNAQVKTANYPFTTLEPNLGVVGSKVIADIPGLIEGASKGKGLGIKFLKHIEKVSLLLHCIAADSPNVQQDYVTVRKELEGYSEALLHKQEIIVLTKIDLVSDADITRQINMLSEYKKKNVTLSIHDWDKIEELKHLLA